MLVRKLLEITNLDDGEVFLGEGRDNCLFNVTLSDVAILLFLFKFVSLKEIFDGAGGRYPDSFLGTEVFPLTLSLTIMFSYIRSSKASCCISSNADEPLFLFFHISLSPSFAPGITEVSKEGESSIFSVFAFPPPRMLNEPFVPAFKGYGVR